MNLKKIEIHKISILNLRFQNLKRYAAPDRNYRAYKLAV